MADSDTTVPTLEWLSPNTSSIKPREIAFIDPTIPTIPDLEIFVSNLRPEIDPVVLSPGVRALSQIAAALREYGDLNGIHIVAHRAPGEINFGSGFGKLKGRMTCP